VVSARAPMNRHKAGRGACYSIAVLGSGTAAQRPSHSVHRGEKGRLAEAKTPNGHRSAVIAVYDERGVVRESRATNRQLRTSPGRQNRLIERGLERTGRVSDQMQVKWVQSDFDLLPLLDHRTDSMRVDATRRGNFSRISPCKRHLTELKSRVLLPLRHYGRRLTPITAIAPIITRTIEAGSGITTAFA